MARIINGVKRYPFSMLRYGHNIELAYNHLKIIECEMWNGEREWDDKVIESLERLYSVYEKAIGCGIYWATGEEYELLKEYSVWVEMYRDMKNGGIR
jgi:hypothetical protein